MGRALQAIHERDVGRLFGFFGLEADAALVDAHRAAIATRFALEVGEIVRLCTTLREPERYKLFREALRLSYDAAVRGGDVRGGAGVDCR